MNHFYTLGIRQHSRSSEYLSTFLMLLWIVTFLFIIFLKFDGSLLQILMSAQ
jgi:hypothetical protein